MMKTSMKSGLLTSSLRIIHLWNQDDICSWFSTITENWLSSQILIRDIDVCLSINKRAWRRRENKRVKWHFIHDFVTYDRQSNTLSILHIWMSPVKIFFFWRSATWTILSKEYCPTWFQHWICRPWDRWYWVVTDQEKMRCCVEDRVQRTTVSNEKWYAVMMQKSFHRHCIKISACTMSFSLI